MSSPRKDIPDAVRDAQARASNPDASAFVAANAGSGKTHVLVNRVIRLLLTGVPPEKILCITFTKAAAANMAQRVFETLGRWVTLPDRELDEAIRAITQIKGFGDWSAHMYLMFSLGRPNIWPVGDLAVREGFKRIHGLEERPTNRQLAELGVPYQPHRSALAMLCWRFCTAEPL